MKEELKENIAIYVQTVGEKTATDAAFKKIKEIGTLYDKDEDMAIEASDFLVGSLKFQTGVIEYLHCSDGTPDEYCESISKNKICF